MSAPAAGAAYDVQRSTDEGQPALQRQEAPEDEEEAATQTYVQRAEDETEEESA